MSANVCGFMHFALCIFTHESISHQDPEYFPRKNSAVLIFSGIILSELDLISFEPAVFSSLAVTGLLQPYFCVNKMCGREGIDEYVFTPYGSTISF